MHYKILVKRLVCFVSLVIVIPCVGITNTQSLLTNYLLQSAVQRLLSFR